VEDVYGGYNPTGFINCHDHMNENDFKQHPVAIRIFIGYLIMWAICALQLYDKSHSAYTSHGQIIDYYPLLVFILTIIYIITLLGIRGPNPNFRGFYNRLILFSFIPIVAVIIMVIGEM
jgi:predicted membrane protein